jgi:Bacterial Ig-like domain
MDAATISAATFWLRDEANALVEAAITYDADTRRAILTPNVLLDEDTTYTATLRGTSTGVKDLAGNALANDFSWSFTTIAGPPPSVGDTTVADFSAGSFNGDVAVVDTDGGEVILAPAAGADFTGSVLPSGWHSTVWNGGGAATVANDQLTIDGAFAGTDALFGPGRVLEFVASFGGAAFQHVGFGLTLNEILWAMFSTGSGDNLYARSRSETVNIETLIPGNWLGTPHLFRIEWTDTSIVYAIDGTVVATHTGAITQSMRPLASDFDTGGGGVVIDWLRLSPYASAGTFTSRVLDAGQIVAWGTVTWASVTPEGTGLTVSVRMGDTPSPDSMWTDFTPVDNSGTSIEGNSRYLQYRVEIAMIVPDDTPVLQGITIEYSL